MVFRMPHAVLGVVFLILLTITSSALAAEDELLVIPNAKVLSVEKVAWYSGIFAGYNVIRVETVSGDQLDLYQASLNRNVYPEAGHRYDVYYRKWEISSGIIRCDNAGGEVNNVPRDYLGTDLYFLPRGADLSIAVQSPEYCPRLEERVAIHTELLKSGELFLTGDLGSTLSRLGPAAAPAVSFLIENEWLSSFNWMGSHGAPAIPAILNRLQDQGESQRNRAFMAEFLGAIGPGAAPATPTLRDILRDPAEEQLWSAVIWALGMIGPAAAETIPDIIAVSTEMRKPIVAIRSLGRMGPAATSAVPFIAELLDDDDRDKRLASAWALGMIGPGATPVISKLRSLLLEDDDYRVRYMAAWAIGRIGPGAESAVADLIHALSHDPNQLVRFNAARALGSIGPLAWTAEPALRDALEDPSEVVRLEAADAIQAVTSGISPAVMEFVEEWNRLR